MDEFIVHNVRLLRHDAPGYVHVRGGAIAGVEAGDPPPNETTAKVDGEGMLVTAGMVDIHTHGIQTWFYENGPEDLAAAAAALGQYGTTTVVPTIVPTMKAGFLDRLGALASAIDTVDGVSIPGLHLEGPFVAITGAACEPRDGDLSLLDDLLAACGGRVTVMSIAPEVKNIVPVIEHLAGKGIAVFITHTRASVEQTAAAIEAGARHATHFYDVFPVPEETDPGVRPVGAVETILAHPHATCDFICDGIHVHPMAIRAAVAAKGPQGVSLITDASLGAGLGPGRYETPWGYNVEVKPGNAPRIANPDHPLAGGLAGSALTMDRGINNLFRWLDLPAESIWAMATANPARAAGLPNKGVLAPGMDADFVLWDNVEGQHTPNRTWVRGKMVFNSHEAANTR